MLVHQAKRLNSPNILITNHDSSAMPNFVINKPNGCKDILKLVIYNISNLLQYLCIINISIRIKKCFVK
jgi:hypothetical protein